MLWLLGVSNAGAQSGEYVIVSGGPSLMVWEKYKPVAHDKWWGNFVRTARVRIQQLRAQYGPQFPITWMVYEPGYRRRSSQEQRDLIDLIRSVQRAYGLNLVFFRNGGELVSYLNNGQPRGSVKIVGFEYFGHSNKACFMFDYSNEVDSGSKAWLHEDELRGIRRGIFAPGAYVKSWGCHSGESYVGKWYAATGVKMWGAVGKTDYSNGLEPFLSSPGGKWTRENMPSIR